MKSLVKSLIKLFIVMGIIVGLLYGGYKIIFDCKAVYVPFGQEFTLEKLDYAKVGDEAIVKLMKIEDFHCKDPGCEGEGEYEYKVLVINVHKLSYVKLGSVATTKRDIEKLGYTLSVENADNEKSVTMKLVRMEKKNVH